MMIKLLYLIIIFFGVRFILNKFTTVPASANHVKNKPKHDDIIDAEYKVMDE